MTFSKKYGFGERWIVLETEPSDGLSANEQLKDKVKMFHTQK